MENTWCSLRNTLYSTNSRDEYGRSGTITDPSLRSCEKWEAMSISKVLIIDDSITSCLYMSHSLQSVGYQTSIAQDGHEGLSLLAKFQPHCLIVDVILPGNINGYTICRHVRETDPRHALPIILVSVKNTPFDTSYGLHLGADRYLSKPFSEETLVRAVWDVLPAYHRPQPPRMSPESSRYEKMLRFEDLVPRLHESDTLLTTSNPFASARRMNRLTRQLLNNIDGHKTVRMLLEMAGLDFKHAKELLKLLYEENLIEFYDRTGRLLTESPFDSF